jgi:hypothetical protein
MRIQSILCLALGLSFLLPVLADGKSKRKRRRAKVVKVEKASQETTVAVTKLMAPFKWGMSVDEVRKQLIKDVKEEYTPTIDKIKEPLEQDKVRREMLTKVDELEKGLVTFSGTRTPWDVSIIEKEFAHRNTESMMFRWGQRDRRFYFFHNDRLWKIYIAFNADLFEGKTFDDFAMVMQARFGSYQKKMGTTVKGEKVLDHLYWPVVEKTVLRALDNTAFYGNFCMVLINKNEEAIVAQGRALNSPKKEGSSLVKAVAGGKGSSDQDSNDNIVDQVTGKGQNAPSEDDSKTTTASAEGRTGRSGAKGESKKGSGSRSPASTAKKRKVDPKDPLSGIDL